MISPNIAHIAVLVLRLVFALNLDGGQRRDTMQGGRASGAVQPGKQLSSGTGAEERFLRRSNMKFSCVACCWSLARLTVSHGSS